MAAFDVKRILSFDVESNGLHGESFAVGAVVIIPQYGTEIARFVGRCPIAGPVDEWVAANVLPALTGLAENYPDARTLRQAFWAWLQEQKAPEGTIVCADVAYPVEFRFLAACQDDDLAANAWNGPYPLHEVATLLLAARMDPDANREEVAGVAGPKHHPAHDALVSALCAMVALQQVGCT